MNNAKIENFLKLAEVIKATSRAFLESLSLKNDNSRIAKMHIGFGNKMLSSFESLIADAKNDRAEAVHHLKTLVESYIYVRWIGQEDTKARLIYAKICKEKIDFFRKNRNYPFSQEDIASWENAKDEFLKGIDESWKNDFNGGEKSVVRIAKECHLADIYSRIYKLSCEPAPISDLLEFMPTESLSSSRHRTSGFWSVVALDYGSFIMISALSDCNSLYELNKAEKIQDIKAEYDLTRE